MGPQGHVVPQKFGSLGYAAGRPRCLFRLPPHLEVEKCIASQRVGSLASWRQTIHEYLVWRSKVTSVLLLGGSGSVGGSVGARAQDSECGGEGIIGPRAAGVIRDARKQPRQFAASSVMIR